MSALFSKILIANRGEIACRIIKTAKRMGIQTVAVFSDADRDALHVQLADEAVNIGVGPASQSYLLGEKIIAAAKQSGAAAIHPGYGFLSENPRFAEQCTLAGIIFVGPPVKAIEAMGDKITSKKIAAQAGVSTVPGVMALIADAEEAAAISAKIGFPVMIKASAGGGGKGMRIAFDESEAREGFELARSEAANSFGDDRIFIEKFITNPRHIEIQVLADSHGNTIFLGERECSIQRRNQKIIEEAPSPFLDDTTRKAMGKQAVALARAVEYQSAGTVEFIVDENRQFYFLEMNTRLQVEHPVTELVTGLDLVELMLRVAAGEALPLRQEDVQREGWAIEGRIYAEDPYRNFLPSVGRLTRYRPPAEVDDGPVRVRNDTGVVEGGEISTFYDPMIAKLCTWGETRDKAIATMTKALDGFEIGGVGHNIAFLQAVMGQRRFQEGRLTTAYISEEFPNGFNGVSLDPESLFHLAVLAGAIGAERLKPRFADAGGMQPHERDSDIAVLLDKDRWDFSVAALGDTKLELSDGSGKTWSFDRPWKPGDHMAFATIEKCAYEVQVRPLTSGVELRWRGAVLSFKTVRPHIATLMPLMPVKVAPDMSRFLVCPMPGQVVRLHVQDGQVVEAGQPLAVVEAMKMENVLRAEKRARVTRIAANVGDVLAVDAIIMEFETP